MNDQTNQNESLGTNLLSLTSNIVVAFAANAHAHITSEILSTVIADTYSTLQRLSGGTAEATPAEPAAKQEPAVSVRKSIQPEFLICLEDGKKVKMLKRYLMTNFSMSPDQYRAKWNLPADYPMVSPNYSEQRRDLAKSIGLGTKGRPTKAAVAALAEITDTDKKTIETEMTGGKAEGTKAAASDAPKPRRGRKTNASKAAAAAAGKTKEAAAA